MISVFFAQFLVLLRRRPVITGCILTALMLGIVNFFLWRDRQEVTQRHEAAREKGEFMLRTLKNQAELTSELAELREALATIDRNAIEEETMEVNFGYFYRLERITRVRIVRLFQLGSEPAPAKAAYKAVPFSLQVSGSYRNVMSLVRELENGPHVLRLRNYSFERGDPGRGELVADLIVEILAKA